MADAMDTLKAGVTSILLIALIGAALVIGLDSFQDDIGTQDCGDLGGFWNTTSNACQVSSSNSTALSTYAPATSYNSTNVGLEGAANATGYLDTIGTLLGVAALVAVVIGAFFVFRRI